MSPSWLASVKARDEWKAQEAERIEKHRQSTLGLPWSPAQGFERGVRQPHPREIETCEICGNGYPHEDEAIHMASHPGRQLAPGHSGPPIDPPSSFSPIPPPGPGPWVRDEPSDEETLANMVTEVTRLDGEHVKGFVDELTHLINKYSFENGSNTPDFILAQYLTNCLFHWNEAVELRDKWYSQQ
jgi:hypothetical protein